MHGRVAGRTAYLDLFRAGAASRYRCDATPWYLTAPSAPESIAELAPDARLIVGVRDPVDQIASLHAHHVYRGIEKETDLAKAVFSVRPPDPSDFRRSVDYLSVARIGEQLERYLAVFPARHVYPLPFSELERDSASSHASLLSWLGLPPTRLESYERRNAARHARVHWLSTPTEWLSRAGRARPLQALGHRLREVNTVPGRPAVAAGLRRRIMAELQSDVVLLERLTGLPASRWHTAQKPA